MLTHELTDIYITASVFYNTTTYWNNSHCRLDVRPALASTREPQRKDSRPSGVRLCPPVVTPFTERGATAFPIPSPSTKASASGPLQDVNRQCIELLVDAARRPLESSFSLVSTLRETLKALTPEMRRRAAAKAFLLVDLEFSNAPWWQTVQARPKLALPTPSWQGCFPRSGAVQLTRATLVLAWHSLRAQTHEPCLLGIAPAVAKMITELSLTEIDNLAVHRFRFVRPRWAHLPAVWRDLLHDAKACDVRRARDLSVRGLQLLTGELIS